MGKDPNLAFANISKLISQYQARNEPVITSEKEFLLAIDNRARAIISTCRGWLNHGDIADVLRRGKKVTQRFIIDAHVAMQKKIIGFLCVTVGTLLHDLRIEKENIPEQNGNFRKLLTELELNASCVMENISSHISLKDEVNYESVVDILEKIDFDTELAGLIELTTLLNGRMLPFSQDLDPLHSRDLPKLEFGGSCYGHVKKWCDEINRLGVSEKMHCLDVEANDYQQNQLGTLLYADWVCDVNTNSDFRVLLTTMLAHIKNDKVYILNLYSCFDHGHVIGVRKIPSSHEIEFFDPNYGTYVFDRYVDFVHFLANLLCSHYYDIFVEKNVVGGELKLYGSGSQPLHAKACLPILRCKATQQTRLVKKKLSALNFSLASVASRGGSILTDMSYFSHHSQKMLMGGLVGTLLVNIGYMIPHLVIENFTMSMRRYLPTLITGLLSGISIEKESQFISAFVSAVHQYFEGGDIPEMTDDELYAMKAEEKHPWVNNMTRVYNGDNNAFLFRPNKNADASNKKRVAESGLELDRGQKRPLLFS